MEIAALILSIMALSISIYNLIEYRSDKKSTHSIQMVPLELPDISEKEPAKKEAPKGKEKKARKFLDLLPEDEIDV